MPGYILVLLCPCSDPALTLGGHVVPRRQPHLACVCWIVGLECGSDPPAPRPPLGEDDYPHGMKGRSGRACGVPRLRSTIPRGRRTASRAVSSLDFLGSSFEG